MASPRLVLYLVVASSLLLVSFPCTPTAAVRTGGFSVALFHRDHSRHSPFFNESRRPWERTRAAVRRSNARAGHLRAVSAQFMAAQLASESNPSTSSFSSKLIPVEQDYLMSFSLGTPPVSILASPDTGSDLTWVQCSPCPKCYKQDAPLFKPNSSSTYRGLPCDADACVALDGTCGRTKDCHYMYEYQDESFTVGVLASDTFTFDSGDDNKKVSFPGIAFGCAHHSKGVFNRRSDGLVGLSRGSNSLVQQLGHSIDGKFSYCLVPPTTDDDDGRSPSSNLYFGDAATVSGDGVVTTPMLSSLGPYDYYVSLDEITVGDVRIPVRKSPSLEDQNAAILVDSGTTLTYLRPSVVESLKSAISVRIQHLKAVKDPDGEFELCYHFRGAPAVTLPDVVFGFTGGNVTLKGSSTFIPIEDGARCLAMLSSQESDGDAIFGSWAQQNLHVGYDLNKGTISFAPADCSKLREVGSIDV